MDDDVLRAVTDALRYIARPTMGLQPGVDPQAFALDGASEQAVRRALFTCIGMAAGALAALERPEP